MSSKVNQTEARQNADHSNGRARPQQARSGKVRSWLRPALGIAAAVLIAGVGWYLYPILFSQGSPAGSKTAAGAPAPVHVAQARKQSYPVWTNGLGLVQASNSVTVRSRVDGQVIQVGFTEGQTVHQGDLLVQLDPAPFTAVLGQANAKLAQDQANLANTQRDLARTTALVKNGNATRQLFDQQTSSVAQLNAQIMADTAAIQSAQVQLNYTTVRAPLAGIVGLRLIDQGNIVHASDPSGIVSITQIEPIAVIFSAAEDQLPAIQKAMAAGPLTVRALSSDGTRELSRGRLTVMDNQIDAASGTIRLKALFDNAEHALWPGMSVQTRLLVDTIADAIVVPEKAVQRGPDGPFAWVVTEKGTTEMRPLKLGPLADASAVIAEGLTDGERVIVSGQYKVKPNAPVRVIADANPRTGANVSGASASPGDMR